MWNEIWYWRLQTIHAMVLLIWARFLIRMVPFKMWRGTLGFDAKASSSALPPLSPLQLSQRLAGNVASAARRLPIAPKCLPRAMTLSWMLRRFRLRHTLVFAVRPAPDRTGADDLHAWVEVDQIKILGELPGPWLPTLRLGV